MKLGLIFTCHSSGSTSYLRTQNSKNLTTFFLTILVVGLSVVAKSESALHLWGHISYPQDLTFLNFLYKGGPFALLTQQGADTGNPTSLQRFMTAAYPWATQQPTVSLHIDLSLLQWLRLSFWGASVVKSAETISTA